MPAICLLTGGTALPFLPPTRVKLSNMTIDQTTMLAAAALAPCRTGVALARGMSASQLAGPPAVTDVPGRGLIPRVSTHTAALPVLYRLDAQPIEQVSPLA